MIVKLIEEHETARYQKYEKEITELGEEFQQWAQRIQQKYFGELTDKQKDEMLFRFSEDRKYLIAVDVQQLLGSKK